MKTKIYRDELTQEYVKSILEYDPDGGDFIWLRSIGSNAKYSTAGYLSGQGYWYVKISRLKYQRGRLAYFYMTGEWPEEIDHIDRDMSNDEWGKLRAATRARNEYNIGIRKDSKNQYKGVYRVPGGRFGAQIYVDYKRMYLGHFCDEW
jgi:hypothetical protein